MSEMIDVVKIWIEKGDHDLGTAIITYDRIPNYSDTIAFHCQQAAEKYLKSYLIFLQIDFKKSHDLNYLLSLIAEKDQFGNEIYEKASILQDFAVEIRYPDTTIDLSDEDIIQAISITREFRKFVLKRMNIAVEYNEIIES